MFTLAHDPGARLPAETEKLPPKAREMLVELLRFAQWLTIHRRQQRASVVCFHAPQWLVAQALGVHDDSVRRYLKNPVVQQVVRGVRHYTEGKYHRIIDGKIFAVSLDPQAYPYPRIAFERDGHYRDLVQDAENGRVRGSYSPQGQSLSQALKDWVLSSGAVPQEPTQAPVSDARTAVDRLFELLRRARDHKKRQHVTLAAKALQAHLNDDPRFLPGWCNQLWRLVRGREASYQHFLHRLASQRDAHGPQGALLLREVMSLES